MLIFLFLQFFLVGANHYKLSLGGRIGRGRTILILGIHDAVVGAMLLIILCSLINKNVSQTISI